MADRFVYAGDKLPVGGSPGQVLTKIGAPNYYAAWRNIPVASGNNGSLDYSVTFNNSGTGDSSGISFNNTNNVVVSYNTIGAASLNQITYIGTTPIALNRAPGNLTLSGISSLVMPGATSGVLTLNPPVIAGSTVITFPATSGIVVTTGDSGTVTSAMIANGTIVDADISASASISLSKLATGALPSGITINSSNITNLSITNEDISESAAITDSKLNTISTADKVSISSLNIDGASDIGADLADADLIIVDDGGGGANRKSSVSRIAVYTFGKVSGDIAISSSGIASISSGVITNAGINASAAIADTKLATISTAGKVSNSATTATSANNASTIVARDASGNFSAGTITANLTGTASNASAVPWSGISSKPTTISGYGIIDAPTLNGNNAMTGANTFTNSTGQIFRQAATQDGILLRGRAGGTGSFSVEIVPTTLTASRTLTTPDVSGTIVTTGDTGSVTSTMIADGTITNTDINASAAIAHSKLANITAGQVLLGNASNVPTATALSGDVTINSSGVTAIGAGVIVDADINASAAIADTKLATISTAGKVSNSATTATSANTASAIVARDASGNFTAGTITANLTGTASNASAVSWSGVSGKPTTISGYGITDAPTLSGNNALTGANTFTNSTGQTFRQASTQDGILLRGRAGGTGSFTVELVPTSLSASRTLTAPDISGTIVTTGDTGSVTSTMIADGTITNTDINASAAIAHTKLASITAGQILLGNSSNVPTATALSGDVTINSSGVTAISAGVIIDADINASAAIVDTKLATISTSGKVSNSATTATSVNTANAIVARDASGNFSAGTIAATFSGNGAALTNLSAGQLTGTIPSNVLGNSTLFIGTTSIALNRSSANQSLTGINSVTLPGATSGTITIQSAAVAGTNTITFPAITGTVITTGDTGTVTDAMLAGSINPTKINGVAMTVSGFSAGDFDGILDEGLY